MRQCRLADLIADFDGFLIDQFGVLVDANGPYPGAIPALQSLITQNKRVVIVTNSGKRSDHSTSRLAAAGFDARGLTDVVSSGEVAHHLLASRIAKGTRIWYHADRNDHSPLDGLPVVLVARPEQADILVLAGVGHAEAHLQDYAELLRPAALLAVPCLCINPDLTRLVAGGTRFGAGLIAKTYEQAGGPVEWIGKPHPAIYIEAHHRLSLMPPMRVLCIGDSPVHDIAGGQTLGFKTALVRTGIHADLSFDRLEDLCRTAGTLPDFILPAFTTDV